MSNDDVFDDVFVESSEGSFDPNENDTFGSWRAAVSYCLAVLCLAVALVSIVFAGVIARTRRFTYNVYIVFLILPDALLNLVMGIRCIYDGMLNNSSKNPPLALCMAEQIGIGFYISSVLLNAIVSKELYTLVNNSYHRKRTNPPTLQKILYQVAFCYGITTVCVIWRLMPVSWAEKTIRNDPYCTATPRANKIVVAVVYMLLLGPPTVYVLWSYDRMTRGKLLPRNGRTRALALYFMRMIGMFLFFYTPMTIVATFYYQFDEDRWDSSAYFVLLSVFTLLNPTKSAVNLVIFWQKDDIRLTFYHYASKIYASFQNIKPSSEGASDSIPAFKIKMKRNSVWRQHDTYEKEDGKLAVVTYCNSEGESIQSDDDDDDDDSIGGMGMRMWMSTPFTLREVSAATEATATEAPPADRASKIVPSAVPTARSNVMSMLSKKSLLSVSENSTNVMSMLSKGSIFPVSENSTNMNAFSSRTDAPPATNGVAALRNLDYFNMALETV